MSEIRQNRLTGEWVIVAPKRAKRGGNLAVPPAPIDVPAYVPTCPFCFGNDALTGEEKYRVDGDDGRWAVRSVVNLYSVLSAEGEIVPAGKPALLGESVNCVGLHEVLIESPRHDLPMALFPVGQVQRVLEAYVHRFRAFYADPRIRHVIVFKNHGLDAGASQQHPHSQVVGIPILPGQVADRIERTRRFFAETGQCLACTLIAQEQEEAQRIVAENDDFIAFIPYAALSPYHLWIFPKVHGPCLSAQASETLGPLAEILRVILAKIHALLANPPFNFVIRSLGPNDPDSAHFHWYIAIVPRVNKTAGFELGTGMYINPSLPENCAQALRDQHVP